MAEIFFGKLRASQRLTYWNFADFLQTRNTAVPGLVKKFELPESRISLETQRKFWAPFLTSSHLAKDIFGNQLDPNNFALDHFLPWTFVVHNQIWNLTPMDRSLNSSKSDQIPRDSYIRRLRCSIKLGSIPFFQRQKTLRGFLYRV